MDSHYLGFVLWVGGNHKALGLLLTTLEKHSWVCSGIIWGLETVHCPLDCHSDLGDSFGKRK